MDAGISTDTGLPSPTVSPVYPQIENVPSEASVYRKSPLERTIGSSTVGSSTVGSSTIGSSKGSSVRMVSSLITLFPSDSGSVGTSSAGTASVGISSWVASSAHVEIGHVDTIIKTTSAIAITLFFHFITSPPTTVKCNNLKSLRILALLFKVYLYT